MGARTATLVVRVLAAIAPLAALALPGALAPLAAQDTRPDTLAQVVGRSVQELVAALPGEPVSLARVVAVALERNVDLEVARAQRRRADAALQMEQGLFDPAASLGWGLSRDAGVPGRGRNLSAGLFQALPWGTQLGLEMDAARISASPGAQDGYGAGLALTVRQPILEGLGTLDSGVRAAAALRRAAASTFRRAQEGMVAGVELAYWDLAEAEAIQAVLQRSLEIADALLFRNRQLAEREIIPEVDVLTARSGVALRRAGFITARRLREDAAESLVFLAWGAGAGERLAGMDAPLKTEGGGAPGAPAGAVAPTGGAAVAEEAALQVRADVAAAREAGRAAEETRRAARRAVLPSLNLEGSLGSEALGTSVGSSLRGLDGDRSWSLGLSFSHPLFNRRDRGVAVEADLGAEIRRLELVLVENQVRQDVRGSLRAVEAGRERLEAAQEAASLARAQLEAERRRLELGLGDSFRLLETEENAVEAELEGVRARYDLARAITLYRLAVGTVLEG